MNKVRAKLTDRPVSLTRRATCVETLAGELIFAATYPIAYPHSRDRRHYDAAFTRVLAWVKKHKIRLSIHEPIRIRS
jgi:hypothetical protein